jgi:type IV pilus assembly protein PilB
MTALAAEDFDLENSLAIAGKIGPEKWIAYRCFPLGYRDDGRLVLVFPKSMPQADITDGAQKLGQLLHCEKTGVAVRKTDDREMLFFEKQLRTLGETLLQKRTVITDADRIRAAQMKFDDQTMQYALRVVTENVAYERDVIGLVYDVNNQALLLGANDDSPAFIDELRAEIRVPRIYVRKMEVKEIRALIQRYYAKPAVAAAQSDMKRMLDEIIAEGINRHSNDIAIEYSELQHNGRIRYFIDNEWMPSRKFSTFEHSMYRNLVGVVRESGKVLPPDANITGDGQLKRTLEGRDISIRVNTMPYKPGGEQRVTMRLISNMIELKRLEDLGLTGHTYRLFERGMKRPGGFNLIAGPTGEGKTTTAYSLMKTFLDFQKKNIMTLEAPIEAYIEGMNQFLISATETMKEQNNKGVTFEDLIRAAMRANPQFLYLGEIRDDETARSSMRAATTGISLLSTIHADDSIKTINRLQEFNVSRFQLAQNLKMTASQRLLKRLCENCKEPTKHVSNAAKFLAYTFAVDIIPGSVMKAREEGCRLCDGTGYKGVIAAFEVLEITAPVAEAIENLNVGTVSIAQIAVENGYRPMAVAALEHMVNGLTSEAAIDCNQIGKLSFTDAQRYVNSATKVVSYVDPEQLINIESDDPINTDNLLGKTA